MIEKMKKRDELRNKLENKFIGRNVLLICNCINVLHRNELRETVKNIKFKKIKIVNVDSELNLIGIKYKNNILTNNNSKKKILIKNKFIEDLIILDTNELQDILNKFITGESIKTALIRPDTRSSYGITHSVIDIKETNLNDICVARHYQGNCQYIETNVLKYIPNLKMEISEDKPLIFQFNTSLNYFELTEVNNIGYKEFEQGLYFGLKELNKAIDIICNKYSLFLENRYNNKNIDITDNPFFDNVIYNNFSENNSNINNKDTIIEKIKNIFKK